MTVHVIDQPTNIIMHTNSSPTQEVGKDVYKIFEAQDADGVRNVELSGNFAEFGLSASQLYNAGQPAEGQHWGSPVASRDIIGKPTKSGRVHIHVKSTDNYGQIKEQDFSFDIADPLNQRNNPLVHELTANLGQLHAPEVSLSNKADLTGVAGYEWVTPPNVNKVGTHWSVMRVKYTDGTFTDRGLNYHVVDQPTTISINPNSSPTQEVGKDVYKIFDAEDVDGVSDLELTGNFAEFGLSAGDLGLTSSIRNENGISSKPVSVASRDIIGKPTKPGTVHVHAKSTDNYGNVKEQDFSFDIVDTRNFAQQYTPKAIPEEVNLGGKYDLTDNIANLPSLPQGTKVVDITPAGTINTNKPGDYTGTLRCGLSRRHTSTGKRTG